MSLPPPSSIYVPYRTALSCLFENDKNDRLDCTFQNVRGLYREVCVCVLLTWLWWWCWERYGAEKEKRRRPVRFGGAGDRQWPDHRHDCLLSLFYQQPGFLFFFFNNNNRLSKILNCCYNNSNKSIQHVNPVDFTCVPPYYLKNLN